MTYILCKDYPRSNVPETVVNQSEGFNCILGLFFGCRMVICVPVCHGVLTIIIAIIIIFELNITYYCFRYFLTPVSIKNNLQNDFVPNGLFVLCWKFGSLRPRLMCIVCCGRSSCRRPMRNALWRGRRRQIRKKKRKKFSMDFTEIGMFYKKSILWTVGTFVSWFVLTHTK